MFLKDEVVKVSITNYNISKIKAFLNDEDLTSGQQIDVKQSLIPKFSVIEVWCKCDSCDKLFLKKRRDIRDKTYCSNECRNKGNVNPNPPKEKIKVNCEVCNTPIFVNESKYKKQEYFLCSRKCYSQHRSNKYHGKNTYNYQNLHENCKYCNQQFKTIEYDLNNRESLFCSQDCYWLHRKENYKEVYFSGRRNSGRQETKPERMVREKLNEVGINYIQEFSIDNTYFADFYLNDHNIILEVYGDYWHVNPEIYGNGKREVNEMQKQKLKKDRMKEGYIKKKGYELLILWEKEIYDNLDLAINKKLLNRINTQESATTTRQAPL